MQNKPLISIIIPTYNVSSTIARCLISCINQTLSDIEILVVDDCGNDDSIRITEEFAKQDSRIRILHNTHNLGTFQTRIQGIKAARGQYILFVDADDYLSLQTCEKAYNAALEYKKISSHASEYECMDSQANLPDIVFFGMRFEPPTWKRISPPIITKPLRQDEVLLEVFAHCATPPWHIWAKLYKASHIGRAINLLVAHMGENVRLSMAEDVLKSFWLCALAKSSIGIKDKLYVYCDSSSSITRKIDIATRDKKIADISRVITELESLSEVKPLCVNKNFKKAQNHAINILKSVRELEYRYDDIIIHKSPKNKNARQKSSHIFGAYLGSCLASLRYHRKWQSFARIALYIFTLGQIKL